MADGRKLSKLDIKVTIRCPENLSESIRQAKINRLYDILKPRSDHNKEGKNSADITNSGDNGERENESDDKNSA